MIDLRLESSPLDLSSDAEIQITASSPVFDPQNVERIFSFPFRLPLTPRNRRARQHSARLDAGNKTTSAPAKLSIESHLLLSGILRQTSVSKDIEEVVISNMPLQVWENLQKIKINEILENLSLAWGTAPQWVWNLNTASFPVQYTIQIPAGTASHVANNSGEVDTAGQTVVDELNALVSGIATYNPALNQITLDGTLIKENPITLIEGLTINFHLNPALWNYNAVTDHVEDVCQTPIESHCFPMIRWKKAYGQQNTAFVDSLELANNVVDNIFKPNERYTGDVEAWQNTVVPCVRVPYILTKIADALGGYQFAGEIWDDADFQKLVVVSNLTLDEVTEDQYEDLAFYKLNSLSTELNLNAHVPQMTAAAFITRLCETFALYLSAIDGQLSFTKKQNATTGTPLNLDGFVDARYNTEPNFTDGWRLSVAKNENETYSDNTQLSHVETGAADFVLETVHTFYHKVGPRSGAGDVKTPHTAQPIQSPVFSNSNLRSTLPLTFLFCYENQPSQLGNDYVFASHDNLNYDGDTVGAYTLAPDGANGLYEKWHKGVIEYAVADKLLVSAWLHIGFLQKLLSWRHTRIRFFHPEGVIIAAVKEVRVSASASGLALARLTLLF